MNSRVAAFMKVHLSILTAVFFPPSHYFSLSRAGMRVIVIAIHCTYGVRLGKVFLYINVSDELQPFQIVFLCITVADEL